MKNILLIEDNVAQAIYGKLAIHKAGLEFTHVENLEDALVEIPKNDAILTDLFFPSKKSELYVPEFLPNYQKYRTERFQRIDIENNPIRYAIMAWAELFGKTTLEEGLEMFEQHTNNYDNQGKPNSILKAARDAVNGIDDFDKYQKFLQIEEDIRNGKNLPLGIIVKKHAEQQRKPFYIVTSTYHHDHAFEPVRHLIGGSYVDTLINGRKNWEAGLDELV